MQTALHQEVGVKMRKNWLRLLRRTVNWLRRDKRSNCNFNELARKPAEKLADAGEPKQLAEKMMVATPRAALQLGVMTVPKEKPRTDALVSLDDQN